MSWRGKLIFARTMSLAQLQAHQMIKPYQQLHYWSTVLFRRGSADVVKYAATPSPDNPARAVQKRNPNALQEELIRHLEKDSETSCFGLQFLDAKRMTYWGNAVIGFWIENASIRVAGNPGPFSQGGATDTPAKIDAPARCSGKDVAEEKM